MDLHNIHARQDQFYDSMISRFTQHLHGVVAEAQAHMAAYLQQNLTITGGKIDQTPANLRLIRTLDDRMMDFLNDAGYSPLIDSFVSSFAGETVFLQETLAFLGYEPVTFTAADLKVFGSLQLNAATSMVTIAEAAAGSAMQQALFSVGGLKFRDLVAALSGKIQASLPRVTTIAETAMTTYFRTISDQAFQKIEKDLPEIEQRYRYTGPVDVRNRPFCHRLIETNQAYSREQIGAMDNKMLPNVFLSAGGYRCRHSWILNTRKAQAVAA